MNKKMGFYEVYMLMLLVLILGAFLAVVFVAGQNKTCEQVVEKEYSGYMIFNAEEHSGFLNSNETMASFSLFTTNDGIDIYMIQVERIGFQNPLYYEESTFSGACDFIKKLADADGVVFEVD